MSAPIRMPNQNPVNTFPASRLKNGVKYATDGQLEVAEEACERWGWASAGMLLVGLIAEAFLAGFEPPHSSLLGRWGPLLADCLVVIGVAGEVQFARMGSRRQGELTQRSKDRLADANHKLAALQKQLAPRFIGPEFSQALQGRPAAHVRIEYLKDAPDTFELSGWIVSRLAPEGWAIDDFAPIKSATEGPLAALPAIFLREGNSRE